jgi:hypothetical protein
MNPIVSAGVLIGVLCGVWTFVMGFTGWYRDPAMTSLFFVVILIELAGLYWGLRQTARHRLRRARRDDAATLGAGAGTDVDHPIAARHHAHVVLDHDHRVAGVHQPVELPSSSSSTSAGCRPVVGSSSTYSVSPRWFALQLGGELDALRLAARELGGRLTEPQVAEPHLRSTSSARRTGGSSAKNSNASSTVIPSTSAMFLPR